MKKKDRREYPNGFYIIDNRITLFRLRPIELAVYNCLCRHGNANHLSHLRISTIAGGSGCAVSSAREAAHRLEALGLISISPDFRDAPGGGRWHGANYYRVLELPAYVHREPESGTPAGGGRKNSKLNNTAAHSEATELPF